MFFFIASPLTWHRSFLDTTKNCYKKSLQSHICSFATSQTTVAVVKNRDEKVCPSVVANCRLRVRNTWMIGVRLFSLPSQRFKFRNDSFFWQKIFGTNIDGHNGRGVFPGVSHRQNLLEWKVNRVNVRPPTEASVCDRSSMSFPPGVPRILL